MTPPEGRALLERARQGSAEALNELYALFGRRLLALIRLRMGSALRGRLDSGDILQATLLRSFQRLDQFRGDSTGSFMSWLARIAENEIRDRAEFHGRERRSARQEVPLDGTEQAVTSHMRSAISQLLADEEAARVERALAALDEDHREVILLRRFEELSWAEIAGRMGRSEDASRMLFTQAMVALTMKTREAT